MFEGTAVHLPSISKRDAFGVYLLLEGATALGFGLVFTVNMVYQASVVGLSPLQLVLVGTLLEGTLFVFEVPTGIVADLYSRRLSILIGLVLTGVGFVVEGSVARFGTVLLAQVLWGLGITFMSGATQAWIADEVGEARAGQAFVRGAQIGMIGGLLAIPLSVGLASAHIQLAIVTGGLLFVALAALLVLIMPERAFAPIPAEERESWRGMLRALRTGAQLVRGRPALLIFVGASAVFGLASEGFDRLWTPHLLDNFTFPAIGLNTVTWFGLIGAAASLLALPTTELVRRRVELGHSRGAALTLLISSTGIFGLMIVFALADHIALAVGAFLLVRTLQSISGPVFNAWVNPHIESSVRATVFSMASQLNAVGQIVGGPGVGLIGSRVSIRAALLISALLLSPVLPLFARAVRETERAAAPPASTPENASG